MSSVTSSSIGLVCITSLLAACSEGASTFDHHASAASTEPVAATAASPPPGGNDWTSNSATACQTYFTPDLVAEILVKPAGANQQISSNECQFVFAGNSGNIDIILGHISPELFDGAVPHMPNPVVPVQGVGDKAVRYGSGSTTGFEAVKGKDRSCIIQMSGNPGAEKVTGEVLGQKFGAICGKLLALP